MKDKVITVTEAAELTGESPATIRHWLRQGWLKSARKAGRVWLISKREVTSFEPPSVGWPAGVARCPKCGGALVEGHKCDG